MLATSTRCWRNLLAAHRWRRHAAAGSHAVIRLVACLWRYWVVSAQPERGHALAEQAWPAHLPAWICCAQPRPSGDRAARFFAGVAAMKCWRTPRQA